MTLVSLLLVLLTKVTFAGILNRRDVVVSRSYRDATEHASFGTQHTLTTLNSGVTVWLTGNDPHNLYGNINVYGQLILSQTDYIPQNPGVNGMDSNYLGTNTQDGTLFIDSAGSISLNDYGSTNDADYVWHLYTFTNNGSLQFCGRGNIGSGSDYSLHCEIDCYNYGVIDWGQYYGYNSEVDVEWENDNKQGPGQSSYHYVYNYGSFRLTNTTFRGRQNIYGDGCWILGSHGTLYLEDGAGYNQNPSQGPTYPSQNIYFSSVNSFLHLDSQTYTINPNFGPQLYGFGTGNAIEFQETIQSFNYAPSTGVLTVTLSSSNHPVYIKLGTGYTSGAFYTAKNPQPYNSGGYNAIFYSGAPPVTSIPSKCQVSLAGCGDPALTAGPFASTTTRTSSATPQPTTSTTSSNPTITSQSTSTLTPSSTATTTSFSSSSSTAAGVSVSLGTSSSTTDSRRQVTSTTIGPNQCICRPR